AATFALLLAMHSTNGYSQGVHPTNGKKVVLHTVCTPQTVDFLGYPLRYKKTLEMYSMHSKDSSPLQTVTTVRIQCVPYRHDPHCHSEEVRRRIFDIILRKQDSSLCSE
ncbi:MAG: hypothetical protein RR902_07735, partial [Oscillospiraceae bacterium]